MRSIMNLAAVFVLCILSFTASAKNINPQEIVIGSGVHYKLLPNDPQIISNQYLWTVNATCIIKSKTEDNFLSFKVTKKQGTLNDEVLVAGDSRVIRLKYNDEMKMTAKSGAEVELLNIGKDPIVTECTFSF